jgi:hypothetical protein
MIQVGNDKAFLHTQRQWPRHQESCKKLADNSHERRVNLTINVPATIVIFWADILTRQLRTDGGNENTFPRPHYTHNNHKVHIRGGLQADAT